MLDTLNQWILTITHPVLDWMLHLPRDAALFIVAIGTALILTGVRIFTTNQDRLRRCKEDKARLKEIKREAKKRGDKETVRRCRTTEGQIGLVTMKAEGLPLLASIVPIALLAVWAFADIAYLPPKEGQAIPVHVTFPVTEIGGVVYLVPQDGVECEEGWVRRIAKDYNRPLTDEERKVADAGGDPMTVLAAKAQAEGGKGEAAKKDKGPEPLAVTNGLATWELTCRKSDQPYVLEFRLGGETFTKDLVVDGVRYAEPVKFYDHASVIAVETRLDEFKLFGIVPGIPWLMLAPWIVGYLVVVLPFSFVLKPVLRIY